MRLNSKAQSAMEYLMTYGWAILIILIAVGALFYLGVFSPSIPSICTATTPITCTDVKGTDGGGTDTVLLNLGASGVTTARVKSMTLNGKGNITSGGANGACALPADTTISSTSISSITLTCTTAGTGANTVNFAKGAKYSGNAEVEYYLTGSTISHINAVQFSGTAE